MVRGFFLRWWNVLKVSKNVLKSWWYLHNSVNILKTIELYTLNRGHIWYVRGFPGSAVVKNPPVNAGDTRDAGLIPGSGRSPAKGNGNPLQYPCLKNSMDRGAWWATVHGVTESDKTDWLNTHTHTHTWYASDISIKLFQAIQNRSWCQHPPESGLGSLWAHLAWARLYLHFVPWGLPSQHRPAPARAQSDLEAWSRDPGKQVWGGCGCENLVWRVPHPSSPGTSLTTATCEQLGQVHGSTPLCQLRLECPALVLTLVWCWSPWGVSMFSGLLSHLVPHSPSSSQPSRGTTPRMAVSSKAQFISVQSLSHVQLFATPWIAACQASLSITNSRSSLRFTSVESVMLSSLAIGTQSLNSCLE